MPGQLMKCGCVSQGVMTAIKGVMLDKPIPACVVHDCSEPADAKPDLTGRTATCSGHAPKPSSFDLAFFEFLGAGSRNATEICKCGYTKIAHDNGRVKCKQFIARGPAEFDRYYCGCRGWD